MSTVTEPRVVSFGPYRVVGLRYVGTNAQGEITALWHGPAGLPARLGEIVPAAGEAYCFGVCRCLPGVTDGSFEYLAAAATTRDAPVPPGMVEAWIPAASYLAYPVASLETLQEDWGRAAAWFAAHPEWQAYCGDQGCECATHPSFELYPADFFTTRRLFIYLPVKAADATEGG